MALILGVEQGILFSNIKCMWEEKWQPAVLKFAESQKLTNRRVKQILDDRAGEI
jgi:hypothetical protein